jgi:hypothetical protein
MVDGGSIVNLGFYLTHIPWVTLTHDNWERDRITETHLQEIGIYHYDFC